jgi:crossover junction endodeoxyribonuclease RuvC
VRILGIDPGLTRCGVGVIDVGTDRKLTLVHVSVIQTAPSTELPFRLLAIRQALVEVFDRFDPDRVALERVFAQQNLRSVMGTAQVSGLLLAEAAGRNVGVDLHTPTEVKASVSGSGRANKVQVANMVRRILTMDDATLLPDATDALALAICNAWRGGAGAGGGTASSTTELTPAQQRWRDAESLARRQRGSN